MQTTPINKLPKDVSDRDIKAVYNPLQDDFTHKFDGKEETIPSGDFAMFPENIARHLARHLSKRIVMTISEDELNERLQGISEDNKKAKIILQSKPFSRFDIRTGNVAKLLVMEPNSLKPVESEKIMEKAKGEDKSTKKETKKRATLKETKSTKK